MISLGCCAFNLALGLEDSLRLVKYLGFQYVDIGASAPTAQVDQLAAAADPKAVGANIRTLAAKYELTPIEFFLMGIYADKDTMVDVNHPDAALRAKLLKQFRGLCQCAAESGCLSIMGLSGKPQPGAGEQADWDTAADTLGKMVAIAKEYGLVCDVEPSVGSVLDSPQKALKMAREVPGLKYTVDYAHFIGLRFSLPEILPLHEFAYHIHAKQARPGQMKSLYHEGQIDFVEVVRDLRQRQWEGVIAMECIGRYVPNAPVNHPVYQSVPVPGDPLPPQPTLVSHPLYQSIVLAEALQRILA
jgi:sugar phosphate isomerase/epimerase